MWWKHNMIPTKGSIQQTLPPPPPNIHLPQASHPLLTSTHSPISPSTLPYFFFYHSNLMEPRWATSDCRLVGEAQKATTEVFTSSPPQPPPSGFFHRTGPKKKKSLKTLEVLKSAKAPPCMVNTHSWHTLLFRLEWAHLEEPHFQGPLYF